MICISDSSDDEAPNRYTSTPATVAETYVSDGAQYYFREISVEDKLFMFKKIKDQGKPITQVAAEHGVLMNNLRFWYLDWIN
jgi:transposase-like protein